MRDARLIGISAFVGVFMVGAALVSGGDTSSGMLAGVTHGARSEGSLAPAETAAANGHGAALGATGRMSAGPHRDHAPASNPASDDHHVAGEVHPSGMPGTAGMGRHSATDSVGHDDGAHAHPSADDGDDQMHGGKDEGAHPHPSGDGADDMHGGHDAGTAGDHDEGAAPLEPVVFAGSIAVGNPASGVGAGTKVGNQYVSATEASATGVSELFAPCAAGYDQLHEPSDGMDGQWFEIEGLGGYPAVLSATGQNAPMQDLNAFFYRADCTLLTDYSMAKKGPGAPEEGLVPWNAAWAVVNLAVGGNAAFEMTITPVGAPWSPFAAVPGCGSAEVDNEHCSAKGVQPHGDMEDGHGGGHGHDDTGHEAAPEVADGAPMPHEQTQADVQHLVDNTPPPGIDDHGGGCAAEADADPTLRPSRNLQVDAMRFVGDTARGMERIWTLADAIVDGYRLFGPPSPRGAEHWIHWDYVEDYDILNPLKIESVMYQTINNVRRPIGAMYIMPPGMGYVAGPRFAGCLTVWHGHSGEAFGPAIALTSLDNARWGPSAMGHTRWKANSTAKGHIWDAGAGVMTPEMLHVYSWNYRPLGFEPDNHAANHLGEGWWEQLRRFYRYEGEFPEAPVDVHPDEDQICSRSQFCGLPQIG